MFVSERTMASVWLTSTAAVISTAWKGMINCCKSLSRTPAHTCVLLNDVFRRRSEEKVEIENASDRSVGEHR